MSRREVRSRMPRNSSLESTEPLGLLGELMMTSLVLGGHFEAGVLVGLDKDAYSAGVIDDVFVGDPVGDRGDDLIARVYERLDEVEDGVLAADRDETFGGGIVGTEVERMARDDGFAKLQGAAGVGVLGEIRFDGGNGSLLNVVGGGEVGLTGAEIDDVDAFAAKTVGVGRDLQGRRNADGGNALGYLCGGLHGYLPIYRYGENFLRRRTATGSGTKVETSPPRVMISLIRRELMKENSSPESRKMVSVSGRMRRFRSAICSSVS